MRYRMLKRIADFLFPKMIDLELINKPDLSESKGTLLAVNHIHALDPIFISYAVYPAWLHHVAKHEIFRIPLLPIFLNWLGVIPVNRKRPGAKTVKKALRLFADGKNVCIFPQGTRRHKSFGRIKKGAARMALSAQVPIYPVAISGLEKLGFRGFFKYPKVRIIFGKPIQTDQRENSKEEIEKLTGELETVMKGLYEQIHDR